MLSIYKYKPETEVILYYFELENEEGKFYKIGLSCNLDPSKRLKGMHKTFNRKVIEFEKGLIKDLYPKEQEYHKFFKEIGINYQPIHKFDGYTECFKW